MQRLRERRLLLHPRKYRKNGDWLSMMFLKFSPIACRENARPDALLSVRLRFDAGFSARRDAIERPPGVLGD
jgi:hypothetical protein